MKLTPRQHFIVVQQTTEHKQLFNVPDIVEYVNAKGVVCYCYEDQPCARGPALSMTMRALKSKGFVDVTSENVLLSSGIQGRKVTILTRN